MRHYRTRPRGVKEGSSVWHGWGDGSEKLLEGFKKGSGMVRFVFRK